MNSDKILSHEEIQTQIQEELIQQLKAIDDSSIKFEEPVNRLTDEKLSQMYPIIYNIWCEYKFEKKSKRTRLTVVIGKNNKAVREDLSPIYRRLYLELDQPVISHLISWAHKAASVVNTYFKDDDYALKKIRFDLLPQGDNKFVIPNLLWENVYLYNPRKGINNIIPPSEYVNMRLEMESPEIKEEDQMALAAFYEAMKKAQEKNT